MTGKLVDTDEIAARVGVDRATIRRWIREGDLPAVRLGSIYRVEEQAFEKWLDRKATVLADSG